VGEIVLLSFSYGLKEKNRVIPNFFGSPPPPPLWYYSYERLRLLEKTFHDRGDDPRVARPLP